MFIFICCAKQIKKDICIFSCIYNKQHSASSQNDFKKNKTQGKMIFNVTMFILFPVPFFCISRITTGN